MDVEELKFIGMVGTAVEGEFGAGLPGQESMPFCQGLYREYVAQGKPAKARAWIRARVLDSFRCLETKPQWKESILPTWPFRDGRPMLFVGQVNVPVTAVAEELSLAGGTLYIFGMEVPNEHGWSMEYEVLEQLPGL